MNSNKPTAEIVHKEKMIGPVTGTIIIVVLTIIAGLYFWAQKLSTDHQDQIRAAADLKAQSTEIQAIKKDLDAANIKGLETQVKALNK